MLSNGKRKFNKEDITILTGFLVQWSGSLLKATLPVKEHLVKDGNILIITTCTYLVGRGQKCCWPSSNAQESVHDKESSDPWSILPWLGVLATGGECYTYKGSQCEQGCLCQHFASSSPRFHTKRNQKNTKWLTYSISE